MPQLKPIVEEPAPKSNLKGLEHLAWLMDRAFKIPGTRISLGLDAIFGLLPVGGDLLTGLVQAGIVLVALYRYRVPRAVAARMAANVLIDVTLGAIPLLGDAFDVFFKANTRNIALLEKVEEQRRAGRPVSNRSSIAFPVFLVVLLVVVLGLVFVGFVTVLKWLFRRPLV